MTESDSPIFKTRCQIKEFKFWVYRKTTQLSRALPDLFRGPELSSHHPHGKFTSKCLSSSLRSDTLFWGLKAPNDCSTFIYIQEGKSTFLKRKKIIWDWRNGSVVKSAHCSSKGPCVLLPSPHNSLELSITSMTRDLIPLSRLCRGQTCMWHTHKHSS